MKAFSAYRIMLMLPLALILGSCTVQKKKGDASPLGKFYHNTTAEYNGYYNADVLMMESILALESQHQDNYAKILPLFKYRETDNPKSVADKLDKAIEKVSTVVALHRVSVWTDDCYLTIGKAQYLSQDFEAAEETLEYLVTEFNASGKEKGKTEVKKKKPDTKKKKKKKSSSKKKKKKKKKKGSSSSKSKPSTPKETPIEPGKTTIELGDLKPQVETTSGKSYFLRHRPCYQEGLLWLARTYIERANYQEADRILSQLDRSLGTFKDVRRELAVIQAYYFMKQKKYAQAIPALEKAIDLERNRLVKARYAFILAQLYQKEGKNQKAFAWFEQVLKYKPAYEMDFNARLQMVKSGASAEASRRELDRMIKDIKNEEFKDQLYFALAELDLQAGNEEQAIINFKESLKAGGANQAQRTESYLALSDLYFKREKFVETKNYLDSALAILPKADERYQQVSGLANNLKDIAEALRTVQLQDSLLALSKLSEEDRRQVALEMKQKEDEERRRQAAEAAQAISEKPGAAPLNAGALQSSFFAYDERALKRGQRDFEKLWGERPLEDNWRRSAKRSLSDLAVEPGEEAPASAPVSPGVLTEEDIQNYFKDVPKTPEAIATAEGKIQDALFSLGRLYRDRLENFPQSAKSLESLINRFPDTKYELDAYFYLYLSYTDMKDQAGAQRYFDLITTQYPDSKYAQFLIDPQFLEKNKDRERQINEYYDQVYQEFQKGLYSSAYAMIGQVTQKFGPNSLQPRFELLKAMCLGSLEGRDSYVAALKDVAEKYPDSPENTRAREMLRLLGELSTTGPIGQGIAPETETSLFVMEPSDQHYILVVFQSNDKLEQAKNSVSDYHMKYHSLDKLRISNIYLGDTPDTRLPVLVVRRFDNQEKAMSYYVAAVRAADEFVKVAVPYTVYVISQNNYRQILKEKNMQLYDGFFRKNYLE